MIKHLEDIKEGTWFYADYLGCQRFLYYVTLQDEYGCHRNRKLVLVLINGDLLTTQTNIFLNFQVAAKPYFGSVPN